MVVHGDIFPFAAGVALDAVQVDRWNAAPRKTNRASGAPRAPSTSWLRCSSACLPGTTVVVICGEFFPFQQKILPAADVSFIG